MCVQCSALIASGGPQCVSPPDPAASPLAPDEASGHIDYDTRACAQCKQRKVRSSVFAHQDVSAELYAIAVGRIEG
eukprot:1371830-Rhodomonas_salina.1